MIRYLRRAFVAHFQSGRALFFLTVAGVALGVAAVVCIQLLNQSAIGAFSAAMTAVHGETDLSVVARGEDFDEVLYVDVLQDVDVELAIPVIDITVKARGARRVYLEILGTDLFLPIDLPTTGAAAGGRAGGNAGGNEGEKAGGKIEPRQVGATSGWIGISAELADQLGKTIGDEIEVSSGSRIEALTIGTLLDLGQRNALASTRVAVMDIAEVQERFSRIGTLDRIDVRLIEGADVERAQARLQDRLGDSVRVLTPTEQRSRGEGLLEAFRLNLTALSLISLFVGLFLIYASVQAAMLRRRRELGVLRSLGATRAQLLALTLSETAIVAMLGVAIGLPLGFAAARQNISAVSGTLTNLYLVEEIERLAVPWWLPLLAAAIGVGGSLAGALAPMLEACFAHPSALLGSIQPHERLRRIALPLALAGFLLIGAAGAWYATIGQSWRPAGFALGIALLLALPLAAPAALLVAGRIRKPQGFGFPLAIRSLALRLRTSAMAAAALGLATSMMFGITLMVGSFRTTVGDWVNSTIRADIYVSSESWSRAAGDARLDDATVQTLQSFDGVRAIDRLRKLHAWIGDHRFSVIGVDPMVPHGRDRFPLIDGDPDSVFAAFLDGDVLIGEPLARKLGLAVGDTLALPMREATRAFRVAGVYYDYTSEFGTVAMALPVMQGAFGEAPINSLTLYLQEGHDTDAAIDAMRDHFADAPLYFTSNATLRAEVFRIFDQTFRITQILQLLALIIASCGVALALLVLGREGAAEVALCRSLGATKAQVFRLYLGKGAGLGVAGLCLGAIGGVGLAWILVHAINRAYFGWTIRVHVPWQDLAMQTTTVLLAVLIASLYPSIRAGRTPIGELSRDR